MDSLFCLKGTPYGGRGLYAIREIPRNTLLFICDDPYATVISRKFRKEVCGYCFAYAFDAHKNTWNIKYDAQERNGVWFCTEECRDAWVTEQNVDGLQGLMNAAVDKLAKTLKKLKVDGQPSFTDTMRPEDITREIHDLLWNRAQEIYSRPGCQTPYLDELELDTVRFLVYAIICRYREDTALASNGNSWQAFLQLQDNEILHARSRPFILDSHIRIYGFLRKVMPPVLQVYVQSSEMVRAILARDQGNTFGLWDMSTKGESEMLGWSVYISGSFFNHDCAPNVRKERKKRALGFYTTRDVRAGEELCINYIDVQDEVAQRRAELLKSWFFNCNCKRCKEELLLVNANGTGLSGSADL